MYKIWFARNYLAHEPNTVLLDNALATMGAGLPSAMAAKIVHPDQDVMAICGDGGFMMNSQGLDFDNPDFVKYAESYGARGHRVASAAELVPLLRQCNATEGVDLVDLQIDYSENDRILTRDLPRVTAGI
ncbi:MAG: hypothetical protein CMJ18_09900 [Phycisphaeraceae bacterium]|nr:hypothetical protein [Phycisphaeraceae bacterium]